MYSKETTDFINEFFRLMTITMAELKATINLGNSYQVKAETVGAKMAVADIQKDIVELLELVNLAQGYSDHIETMVKDCVSEHIMKTKLVELTIMIHGKLLSSVERIEVQLKEMGLTVLRTKR